MLDGTGRAEVLVLVKVIVPLLVAAVARNTDRIVHSPLSGDDGDNVTLLKVIAGAVVKDQVGEVVDPKLLEQPTYQ